MTCRALLSVLAIVAASGCVTGKPASRHPLAIGPAGAQMDVRLRKSRVKGELLEVRDTAFVILGAGEMTLVPFRGIRTARFLGVDGPYVTPRISREGVQKARLLSRFPFGIPEPVLRELLESRQQTEVAVRVQ